MGKAATRKPAHSPAQNTKVEQLAEAIENMALGILATKSNPASPPSKLAKDFLASARADIRTKLQAFLVPALNLIEGGPRQGEQEDREPDDRIMCAACKRHSICSDIRCPNWHKAIQAGIAKSTGVQEVADDDGPEVA